MDKKQLRKSIKEYRSSLTKEFIAEHSHLIMKHIMQSRVYQDSDVILCYVSMNDEVDTEELIEDAWDRGKTVAVPRVKDSEMEFYEIFEFSDLEKGSYGIMEPRKECQKVQYIDRKTIVIMPGLAFDRSGNRLGYGGGFYDRYFVNRRDLFYIAPVFEGQIFADVPTEPHDQKVNMLVCESGIMEIEDYE